MKLLTKNTDYAVRALMELGQRPDEFLSARHLAEAQDIPYHFLRKLLRVLIGQGVVDSREGGSGGVRLKAAPDQIKVVDVIRMFQGDIQLSACMFRRKICQNRNHCVLRENILKIEETVHRHFASLTIAKLIRDTRTKKRKGKRS